MPGVLPKWQPSAAGWPGAERSDSEDLITPLGGSENRRAEELIKAVKQRLSRGLRRSAPASLPAIPA